MKADLPFPMRYKIVPFLFLISVETWVIWFLSDLPWNWKRIGLPLLLPAMLSMSSAYFCGHPRNWWRQWFGTFIQLDLERGRYKEYKSIHELVADIKEWLAASNIRYYHHLQADTWQFLRKRDAVMFKVAWG